MHYYCSVQYMFDPSAMDVSYYCTHNICWGCQQDMYQGIEVRNIQYDTPMADVSNML